MVIPDLRLVVEPTYRYAKQIEAMQAANESEIDVRLRNTFWSWRHRRWVSIWERQGKIIWTMDGTGNATEFILKSLNACDAWGIEQEANAVKLMATLVSHRQFKHYLLTGSFMESSKRSKLVYVFRRLRPTLAVSLRGCYSRILCAMCMHPIGYYEGSWAGAMAPTDDVIAHLMLMRGDEHMFWRRSNQHSAWEQQSGI